MRFFRQETQPYFDQPCYVGFAVGGFELGLVLGHGAQLRGRIEPGGAGFAPGCAAVRRVY